MRPNLSGWLSGPRARAALALSVSLSLAGPVAGVTPAAARGGGLTESRTDMPQAGQVGVAPATGDPQTAARTRSRSRTESPAGGDLLTALALQPGATVAEIGAGAGATTLRAATLVGTTGRVYTTELGDERLRALRRAVEGSTTANITVVDGDPNQTNLPEQCCDALFMENVYHHFQDPAVMNASLLRSLKPGGRLAISDFAPDDGESAEARHRGDNAHHGVTAETVRRELLAAGFEIVPADDVGVAPGSGHGGREFLVVARKPGSATP